MMHQRCLMRVSSASLSSIQPLRSVCRSRNPGWNSSVFTSSIFRYQRFNSSPYSSLPQPQPTNSVQTQQQKRTVTSASDLVNPPLSTIPAPIEVPERGPDDSAIGYYFRLGKGYLTFYKTGLMNVWRNYKKALEVEKAMAKAGGIHPLIAQEGITRAEYQLAWRSRHDSRRIPLFVLMFMVCGEFTPLLVLYFSRIVPLNCRIPKQLAKDRSQLEARRTQSFATLRQLRLDNKVLSQRKLDVKLDELVREEILHCSRALGLHSKMWPEAFLPPTGLLKYRLRRRLGYLEIDDKLLLRAGGPNLIAGGEELKMALIDRGMDILNKSEDQLRKDIQQWFKAREYNKGIGPGFFLTR